MKKTIALLLLALLSACDDGISLHDVAGKWQLADLDGRPVAETMRGGAVTLEIQADGKFSGQAPVNRYFGQITIEGSTLRAGPVGATMMAGAPEQMQAEQDFFQTLNAIKGVAIKNGKLYINGPNGKRLLLEKME